MTNTARLENLRASYNDAVDALDRAGDAYEGLLRNAQASDSELAAARSAWDEAKDELERRRINYESEKDLMEARAASGGIITTPADSPSDLRGNFATARGSLRFDSVYRPDGQYSFFRDLLLKNDSFEARERLERQQREVRGAMTDVERRTFDTTAAGGFSPPQYLGELWAQVPRAARPFANRLPKHQLTEYGMSIVVPRLTGGGSVAGMGSENSAVSSATPTETDLTVPVVTVAGQIDLSRQSVERTTPGMDQVLFSDLMRAYDEKLETYVINGTGSSGQHLGVLNVSSTIGVTYTAATPTGAALVPVIYNVMQQIASQRYANPNVILMHPRRAAFLAKEVYTSQAPIVQQGGLFQALGTQDGGFLQTFAGLEVVVSAAVPTTLGAGTNEDRIVVCHVDDLYLCETPVNALRFEDVGSGTLTIRLQVYNYSAFISGRQPKSIGVISGTGLANPTF